MYSEPMCYGQDRLQCHGSKIQNLSGHLNISQKNIKKYSSVFSSSEAKAQVSYSDRPLSIVLPSLRPSVGL
jgi:hypothetical protein